MDPGKPAAGDVSMQGSSLLMFSPGALNELADLRYVVHGARSAWYETPPQRHVRCNIITFYRGEILLFLRYFDSVVALALKELARNFLCESV